MDDLTASIERALCEVHQMERTVQMYKESSQLLLFERTNNLVKELATMRSAADRCEANIPLDVIRFVDDGRNPDAYTRDFLNECIVRNEATKGKVEAFKSLRQNLLEEMEDAFPAETEAYRALRQASLESTKLLRQEPRPPQEQMPVPLVNGSSADTIESQHVETTASGDVTMAEAPAALAQRDHHLDHND